VGRAGAKNGAARESRGGRSRRRRVFLAAVQWAANAVGPKTPGLCARAGISRCAAHPQGFFQNAAAKLTALKALPRVYGAGIQARMH